MKQTDSHQSLSFYVHGLRKCISQRKFCVFFVSVVLVLYDNERTIQGSGCLITGCKIKWLLGAVVLGQWPHPCEVMQGNHYRKKFSLFLVYSSTNH